MRRLLLLAVLCALAAPRAVAGEVGFSRAQFTDADGDAVKVGIWYPTDAAASDEDVGLFTQHVAPDAPVSGAGHALVVISHGTGGALEGHYDTAMALAGAGYVVAALAHPGDNFRDDSRAADLAARPRAVRDLVGFMLADWVRARGVGPGEGRRVRLLVGGLHGAGPDRRRARPVDRPPVLRGAP